MNDDIHFNCQLNLGRLFTTEPFEYKDQNPVMLSVFKGTFKFMNEIEDLVIVRIPFKNGEIVEAMKLHFQNARSLDKTHFIMPRHLFMDNENAYFCYEYYDETLRTLMGIQDSKTALKKAMVGFLEALSDLHRSSRTHGHITEYNLVTKNEKGYLTGGVGVPFSTKAGFSDWSAGSPYSKKKAEGSSSSRSSSHDVPIDGFKDDVECFTKAVRSCTHDVNDINLTLLMRTLATHGRMNKILYHPYVQSSRNISSLFIYAWQVVSDEFVSKHNPGDGTRDQMRKLNKEKARLETFFATAKMANNFTTPDDWQKEIKENPKHRELFTVCFSKEAPTYSSTDVDLFKFMRNYFVHAKKDKRVTIEDHYDHLYDNLEQLCPGFASIVYQVLYGGRFAVFL